jgi:hypothetical protein
MHRGVINEDTALLHHFLDMAKAQRVSHIPAHAGEHDFQQVVQPFEDLAQSAVNQLLRKSSMARIVIYAYCDRTQEIEVASPKWDYSTSTADAAAGVCVLP